jgi:hypothetical protein
LVGRKAHFLVSATFHYAVLFVALVGSTATGRKGTSWDFIYWLLRSLDEAWATERIQGGLVSGEGLIYHVRDPTTRREPIKEKGRVTGYQVVEADPGVEDKRLLSVETELSRMFKAMNRESNTLSDVARQAWDCRPVLSTLAKNSPNRATEAHVSIIGHITRPDVARHLAEVDSANGFGNRFLWACVRQSKELPEGGRIMEVDWAPIRTRLAAAFQFARGVGAMARDEDAKEVWRGVYGELSAPRPGLLGAMLTRGVPQVMRLACIYALLDRSAVVKPEHLNAALAVWQYCEDSARYIFGQALGDSDAERLLTALGKAPEGLAQARINAAVFHGHKKSADLVALLSRLLSDGLIHRRERTTGGRPATVWFKGRDPEKKGPGRAKDAR